MKKIVIATANLHKVEEIKAILKDLKIEVLSLWDFGLQDVEIEENGNSFEANALIKAKFVADQVGLPAISDDSGICVDILGGAPGIYSARYAGQHGDDEKNIDKLLHELEPYPEKKDRTGRFVSAIAFVAPTGQTLFGTEEEQKVFLGEVEGIILKERTGTGGFGYDPIFYYEPFQKSFGEVSPELKNTVSHRSNALRLFREYLTKNA